jgi:hypothetical protein
MSVDANSALLEHAVELADDMNDQLENPFYINLVAQLIEEGDLDSLRYVVRDMRGKLADAAQAAWHDWNINVW